MFPARLNAAEWYAGVSGTTVPTKARAIARSDFLWEDITLLEVAQEVAPVLEADGSKTIGCHTREGIRSSGCFS